jgi:hypothetical protein
MNDVPMNDVIVEIVTHMLKTYHMELKTGTSHKAWLNDLKSKAGILHPSTAKKVIGMASKDPEEKNGIGPKTINALVEWFKTIPGWKNIDASWFYEAKSLDDFLRRHEGSKNDSVTRIGLEGPLTEDAEQSMKKIPGVFVAYRFAYEHVGAAVAREVAVFEPDKNSLPFKMAYRITGEGDDVPPGVFHGNAAVFGRSVVGLASSNARGEQRVRSLLFADTDEINNQNLKFGMLMSTKIGTYAPCVACIVLFRVRARVEDLASYYANVAKVRPLSEFLENDFAPFTDRIRDLIPILLTNTPDAEFDEKSLWLHLERFVRFMGLFATESHNLNDPRVPWTPAGVKAMSVPPPEERPLAAE